MHYSRYTMHTSYVRVLYDNSWHNSMTKINQMKYGFGFTREAKTKTRQSIAEVSEAKWQKLEKGKGDEKQRRNNGGSPSGCDCVYTLYIHTVGTRQRRSRKVLWIDKHNRNKKGKTKLSKAKAFYIPRQATFLLSVVSCITSSAIHLYGKILLLVVYIYVSILVSYE